jgi:hypothetical protein
LSVYAEVATIASGVASLVAVVLAIRALNDSNRTAGVLVESQRLLESAQERAEREQAARVLTVGHDLARRIQIFWQRTLVDLESHPHLEGHMPSSGMLWKT